MENSPIKVAFKKTSCAGKNKTKQKWTKNYFACSLLSAFYVYLITLTCPYNKTAKFFFFVAP